MEFIEGLPLSDGNDMILVVVCHLNKMALFIPTFCDIDAEDLACIFLSQVFAKNSTLTDIYSDQGKHFISIFWRLLCQLLGIKANLLTAYHPETDVLYHPSSGQRCHALRQDPSHLDDDITGYMQHRPL